MNCTTHLALLAILCASTVYADSNAESWAVAVADLGAPAAAPAAAHEATGGMRRLADSQKEICTKQRSSFSKCKKCCRDNKSCRRGCKTCRSKIRTSADVLECGPGFHVSKDTNKFKCFDKTRHFASCQQCATGHFSVATSKDTLCTPHAACAPGKFIAKPGTMKTDSICSSCDAGRFSDKVGATSCKRCPRGRFNSVTGQSKCAKCDAGKRGSLKKGAVDCTDEHIAAAKSPHEVLLPVCPTEPVLQSLFMSAAERTAKYDEIKGDIISLYDRLDNACDAEHCQQGDFAGCALRMAGHDFMDWSAATGRGGSDGCVDFEDPDNKGLKPCLAGQGEFGKRATIGEAYAKHCSEVSLADFFVIAAEAIMVRTRPDYVSSTESSPTLELRAAFRFGRRTAKSCGNQEPLPSPESGCDMPGGVKAVFVEKLGLGSWRKAAALMGVHTLGRAKQKNSGYKGWWVSGDAGRMFSNNYYRAMMTGWVPDKAIGGNRAKNQWKRKDHGPKTDMMLDTDLCLFYATDSAQSASDACVWTRPDNWPSRAKQSASPCINAAGKFEALGNGFSQLRACCGGPPRRLRHIGTGSLFGDPASRADIKPAGLEAPRRLLNGASPQLPGIFGAKSGPAAVDVAEFARDETLWLQEFSQAWTMVTENGAIDLTPGLA